MWEDNDLEVYHGCEEESASTLIGGSAGAPHGIDLARCRATTDFGRGFYTTTNLHQAEQWANTRVRPLPGGGMTRAAVVAFSIQRGSISGLEHMAFVREGNPPGSDYWELVAHCRAGGNHRKGGGTGFYDVVYGPVSLFPKCLVIQEGDQISFHTSDALSVLSKATILSHGTPTYQGRM